jgi:DNA-binding NtrC family response regulator
VVLADGPVAVLVVDDEDSIRNALKRFLTGRGYEVQTAATGAEALAAVQRQKITCVLLDVRLPDVSGVDLVPQLLQDEPNAAILMLTAVNDATSAALCMQRGAYDYLS